MLTCAISLFAGDAAQARKLLFWIERLSNVKAYELLLCCDAGTPFDVVTELMVIGDRVFGNTHATSTPESVTHWPRGCNANWMAAMKWGAKNKRDVLFLEPDAIPLKPTWLDDLNAAWESAPEGTNYLGNIEACAQLHLPPKVISGVGIYSHRVGEYALVDTGRPWNVDYADLLIPHAVHSPLIKDFFGQKNLPPVFVKERNEQSPSNALTLDWIPPEAVVFHRDKGHSLIPLLYRHLFNEEMPTLRDKLAVVFNVHKGDITMAIAHAQWLDKMGMRSSHRAVVAHDNTCPPTDVKRLQEWLGQCFDKVDVFKYPMPRTKYPQAANHAWQTVARRMAMGNAPWLWMEADAVALVPDWVEQLQAEYDRGKKLWMGSVVTHMGHINGTSIYPPDAAQRMPRAMNCREGAFDMWAKDDIGGSAHDAGHKMFHTWSIAGGDWCPVGGGHLPINISVELAERIPPGSVMIHRVKDFSLLSILMAGWRIKA